MYLQPRIGTKQKIKVKALHYTNKINVNLFKIFLLIFHFCCGILKM